MSADYKVQRLYDEYIHDIVSNADNWKNFLRITGRIYRYEFDNILMVYAQRPNATLVGDYDSWKKVGRYVKKGSRGIAIFSSKILKPHMRYIFDISDTGGKNVKLTWDLNGDNLKSLVDELTEEGKIEPYLNDDRKNLENLLKNYTKENIRSIMKEKSEAGISELNRITGGVINGGDNETQGLTVEEMLYESVLYAVCTRCGFDMSAEEQDMSFIINISDEDDICRFGSLVCDVSCSVLKEFNYRVRRIEKERSVTNGRKENNLSRGSRRNAVSESGIATGTGNKHDTDRKVRNDGSRVSEGKREEQIQHTVSSGKTGRENEGSGHGGKQPDGHVDGRLLKATQTSESYFNNGNVEAKKSGKDDGRGSGSKSDSVQISLENESENYNGQINEELNKELDEINSFGVSGEAGFEQASFLFDDNTKEITVADSKKPLSTQRKRYTYMEPKKERVVPHDYIVSVLLRGTGFVGGKERMLNEQIEQISYAIDETKEKNGERWTVKQMEVQKKRLKEQLKTLTDEQRKDDLITFEELGIDCLMVDEAHNYKNLAIFSKINNVSGISSSGAKKATDMQLKCQYINEINPGRGIVFATGTPISNTMCEMYVMQSYLQKDTLEEKGIYHFDSWAANFGEITTTLELTVEGSGFRMKSRFNKFTNLPELMNIFKQVADVQTQDMLELDVPKLRDGKYIIVESEPDWYVKQVMEDFVVRAERIRNGGVDSSVDNFLKITHEARLLGTDARLLDKNAPNNPDGKLNKVVQNVFYEYDRANSEGKIGCQLVFSDIGTPGGKDFDVYNYVKSELVKKGIPENEIAFIHDAKTDAQRDILFKEMRTGKKKILIGSTDKCGTGVNVQTHLVAMHHIDCPWKPSSIEQREGRGIRQGNLNKEVAVYRYVTKETFDAYSWSLVENKQRFISQVMTSKAVSRTCEDIDEATLSYAEIKAVATGNPLIKEKMELDNELQRLKLLKSNYDSQRYTFQDNFMIKYPKLIKAAEEKLKCVKYDIEARDKELLKGDEFAITVGKSSYDERSEGGTALLEAVSKSKSGDTYEIGSFRGFTLLVEKNYMGINYMILRGKTEYKAEMSTSPVGNMIKLDNLFNNLNENEEFLKKKIEQYKRDMESSKSEYEKPFAYEKELSDKQKRQAELNAMLDLEKNIDEEICVTEQTNLKVSENVKNTYTVNKDSKTQDTSAYPNESNRDGR